MAGLLAARVLSSHFEKVYLVERDLLHDEPESRKGQPHTAHLHALLSQGLHIMHSYFPDLLDALRQVGAPVIDPALHMRWFLHGGYRARFRFGMDGVYVSRTCLEWLIRQRVLTLANIEVLDGHVVQHLVTDARKEQVIGVQVTQPQKAVPPQTLLADLVMDASGRGSRSPSWLADLGYPKPQENRVTCGTGYTSRIYRRNPADKDTHDWLFITPDAPREQRGGGAFPIEGDRWMVSLGGWHGSHAPHDEAGFLAFAQSLPAPDIANLISRSEPLSGFFGYKYPYSQRRRYEKLSRFPQGYLLLGDAIASFNPLYGQGMTTAALQAAVLDKLLGEREGKLQNIAQPYFRQVARLIDTPWRTAVSEDFRFPQTVGKKAPGTDLINAYVTMIHRATHTDAEVGKAFFRVMNMIDVPGSLFHPSFVWRVLRNTLGKPPRLRPTNFLPPKKATFGTEIPKE